MKTVSRPEIRTDILTGRKCIVAPERAMRPSAVTSDPPLSRGDDPFAEGSEHETPNERFAIRSSLTQPNQPGWTLRVVPNRYPAVSSEFHDQTHTATDDSESRSSLVEDDICSAVGRYFPVTPACGEHDVVIECPDGRSRLVDLTNREFSEVMKAWRTRFVQVAAVKGCRSLSIFRNEGFSAGASLFHCHSQIVGSRDLTPLDEIRHQRNDLLRSSAEMDLPGDLLMAEQRQGSRIVLETDRFTILCPFAPRSAWHLRFVPRAASWSFMNVSDPEIEELASHVIDMLKRLEKILGQFVSFNLILPHSRIDKAPEFRWMLDLIPRISRIAGLELLTDLDLISIRPETAAERLRCEI